MLSLTGETTILPLTGETTILPLKGKTTVLPLKEHVTVLTPTGKTKMMLELSRSELEGLRLTQDVSIRSMETQKKARRRETTVLPLKGKTKTMLDLWRSELEGLRLKQNVSLRSTETKKAQRRETTAPSLIRTRTYLGIFPPRGPSAHLTTLERVLQTKFQEQPPKQKTTIPVPP
jgi:hypothetical protein